MLIDKVQLQFIAGRGGNGAAKYDQNKRPRGGDGGHGGNIYIEGSRSMYDLRVFSNGMKFKAGPGGHGDREKAKGASGEDLIIKVPLITVAYDEDGSELCRIENEGQRYQMARGGKGGWGNFRFRNQEFGMREKTTSGEPGESKMISLEMRLPADVLFIGLPNAGKSSTLNVLTNANVKVASYPFTTIQPQLGTVDRIVFMDFPGLIEGTAKGKGLGTRYLKHMLTSKLVLHMISLESQQMEKDYKMMRQELKEIHEELYGLPEIIVLTKADLFDSDYVAKAIEKMKKYNENTIAISSAARLGIKDLMDSVRKRLRLSNQVGNQGS